MKVLIIKTSSLGDVIHTLPAVTDAWLNFKKDIQFDWTVEEAFAEIPAWHPAIKNVIIFPWRRLRKNLIANLLNGKIAQCLKNLRQEKYDLVIDAQGLLFKSGILALLARGQTTGYDRSSIRDPWSSFCYQKKYAVSKNQHAINRMRELFAKSLNYSFDLTTPPDYFLQNFCVSPNEVRSKTLIFIHGTSRENKCWPEKNWQELATLATKSGFNIKIPWGNEEEKNRALRIAGNNPKIEVLPKLNLTSLAKIFANANGAIAVDTGLGHLAAALGLPTLSLYGPTNPKLIGTIGKHQVHLQAPTLNCADIAVTEVWKKLFTLLNHPG